MKIQLIDVPELLSSMKIEDVYSRPNEFKSLIDSDNSINIFDVNIFKNRIFFKLYEYTGMWGLLIYNECYLIDFGVGGHCAFCTLGHPKLYRFVIEQLRGDIPDTIYLPDFMKYVEDKINEIKYN